MNLNAILTVLAIIFLVLVVIAGLAIIFNVININV